MALLNNKKFAWKKKKQRQLVSIHILNSKPSFTNIFIMNNNNTDCKRRPSPELTTAVYSQVPALVSFPSPSRLAMKISSRMWKLLPGFLLRLKWPNSETDYSFSCSTDREKGCSFSSEWREIIWNVLGNRSISIRIFSVVVVVVLAAATAALV